MSYLTKLVCLFLIYTFSTTTIIAAAFNDLPRRANWDARFSKQQGAPGMTLKKLESETPLAKAGVVVGDTLLSVDGKIISSVEDWYDLSDALVANKSYSLLFRAANGESKLVAVEFNAIPYEQHDGIDTFYETVLSDYAVRQRVIITKPKSKQTKQAAVFVLQGLSCSSIEKTRAKHSNWTRLLMDLVNNSNMVVMRVEKPGMGDSEGDCSKTDFNAELNGYETAIKHLLAKDYVDTSRVVVYGNSMGSALAPYFANKYKLAGVVSDGTYLKTWFEHMLEIERRIRAINGDSPEVINQKMLNAYIPLYYGMLIEQKSYQELIAANPLLAEYNYHGQQHMYGRPMSFYHQLNRFNVAAEWAKLKVPARIRWGTNDWIMSEQDNDQIINILEQAEHPDFKLYKYPNMDHWLTIHKDYQSSFFGKEGQWEAKISRQIVDWIKQIVK